MSGIYSTPTCATLSYCYLVLLYLPNRLERGLIPPPFAVVPVDYLDLFRCGRYSVENYLCRVEYRATFGIHDRFAVILCDRGDTVQPTIRGASG